MALWSRGSMIAQIIPDPNEVMNPELSWARFQVQHLEE